MTTKQSASGEIPVQTVRDQLRNRLALAEQLAVNPAVKTLLGRALAECSHIPYGRLVRCAQCGRRGLPERIVIHDCPNE